MRFSTLTAICIMMTLGLALGLNYGSYASYGSVPYGYDPPSQAGGFSNTLFAAMLGLLLIFTILFNNGSFNNSSPSVVLTSGK